MSRDDDSPRELAIAEAIGAYVGAHLGRGLDCEMYPGRKEALDACAGTAFDRGMRQAGQLREQWAALFEDGTWTSGADLTSRAEAQDIVDGSRVDPPPRLARRWVSDWRLAQVVDRG